MSRIIILFCVFILSIILSCEDAEERRAVKRAAKIQAKKELAKEKISQLATEYDVVAQDWEQLRFGYTIQHQRSLSNKNILLEGLPILDIYEENNSYFIWGSKLYYYPKLYFNIKCTKDQVKQILKYFPEPHDEDQLYALIVKLKKIKKLKIGLGIYEDYDTYGFWGQHRCRHIYINIH